MNNDFLPPGYSDWMTDPAPTEEDLFESELRTEEHADRLIDEYRDSQHRQTMESLPLSKVERTMADFFTSLTIPKK